MQLQGRLEMVHVWVDVLILPWLKIGAAADDLLHSL